MQQHDSAIALYWQEKKNWLTWQRETDILTRTQVPHSVLEILVSCLIGKLGRQNNDFNLNDILVSYVSSGKIWHKWHRFKQ